MPRTRLRQLVLAGALAAAAAGLGGCYAYPVGYAGYNSYSYNDYAYAPPQNYYTYPQNYAYRADYNYPRYYSAPRYYGPPQYYGSSRYYGYPSYGSAYPRYGYGGYDSERGSQR